MRTNRIKAAGEGYYHVVSRIVNKEFFLDTEEKDIFVEMMRKAQKFSGVDVLTFAVLDNHFHILVRVPEREDVDEEVLLERVSALYGEDRAASLRAKWEHLREDGDNEAVEVDQAILKRRMYDVSEFVKTLKMRYSISYNARKRHEGTLWEGRFKSVLVEPHSVAMRNTATYIELNAVRAKIVSDPSKYRWCGYGEACRGVADAIAGIEKLLPPSATPKTNADALREYCSWFGGLAPDTIAFPVRVDRLTNGLVLGGRKYVCEVGTLAGFTRGTPSFVPCPGEKGETYALRRPRRVTA